MKLHSVTEQIIHEVEVKTGYPAHVMPDEKLSTIAVVRIARGKVPIHTILYKPDASATLDYTICFQCGFVLRMFENEPQNQFEFGVNESGRQEVSRLLNDQGGAAQMLGLKTAALTQLRDQLFDGLMTQLRSVPIGMRVDLWLLNNYAELRDQQRASVLQQIKQNVEVLRTDMERVFPQRVYRPSAMMNIAYAQFWAGLYGELSLARKERAHKYYSDVVLLLKALEEMPADASHDRELLDKWAKQLNLESWYNWVKYEPPA